MRETPISVILTPEQNLPAQINAENFLSTTIRKAKELSDDIYLLNQEHQENTKSISAKNSVEFLDYISENLKGRSVIILNAYSPLLDLESTRDMLSEHRKLAFDFSYSENLPEGLLPDIIEADIIDFIRKTVPESTPLFKESIKELFESDISSYDSNIYILPSRLVELRVNFRPNSWNNYLITQAVIDEWGADIDILSLEEKLRSRPDIIRQRPTYYEIQLTTERESGALFLGGRQAKEGVMALERLEKLISDISDFSKDPVILFGFYGEPLLHPDIDTIMQIIDRYPKIRFIFESRGFLNNYEKAGELIKKPNVELIVDISFSEDNSYREHKKPLNNLLPFESLNQLEERVKALLPIESVYPQFTRSTLNEDQLMRFYQKWKDYQDRIIIKKLDTFGGAIKQYEVVDLSPVKRGFCLHLKHDMLILNDGTVALNRDDVKGELLNVNAIDDGLEYCWQKMGELYLKQWESGFTQLEDTCNCDNWWVFNF